MSFIDAVFYPGMGLMLLVLGCGGWRIVRGPTTLDRLLGLDTFTVALVGFVLMFSIREGTPEFMELVLIVTALGFFTTVCFYYYLSQPKRRSGEDFNERDPE